LFQNVDKKSLRYSHRAADQERPFFWTKDSKIGYTSFDQCYSHWWRKSQKDLRIDLSKVFNAPWYYKKDGASKLYHDSYIQHLWFGNERHPSFDARQNRTSISFVKNHAGNIEFLR